MSTRSNVSIKGSPSAGLWGATLGFFVGFAAVSLFSPMINFLKESGGGINPGMFGLLVSIPALTGSLLRIPFAAWVDTTGGRKPFIILLSLATVGIAGIYMLLRSGMATENFYLLLFFGLLAGCGIATFSVGIGQTSYWFKQSEQGFALGKYAGIGNLAPGIFNLILPGFLLGLLGLVNTYLAWVVFMVIGLILYILLGRNAWYFQLIQTGHSKEEAERIAKEDYQQELFPKSSVRESLMVSAKVWQTWGLVAIYFVVFGGFVALTSWLPTYWIKFWGLGLAAAGPMTALYSILCALARVGFGKISDRFGGKRVSTYALILTILGAVLIVFSTSSLLMAVIGLVIMALGMGSGQAATFKMLPGAVPQAIGGAAGWVGGLGAFGGFVIPNLLTVFLKKEAGAVGPNPGYASGFWVFVVLGVISLLVLSRFHSDTNKEKK